MKTREEFFDIKNRSITMERLKREAAKRPVGENLKLKFPEIKKDFEQIQKSNDQLQRLIQVKGPLDYSALLMHARDIKNRASRLHSNLFSTELKSNKDSKNKQQISADSPNIKTLFINLDKSIISFVHNPIFQNINLLDLNESLKAQQDLETIIEISVLIKNSAKNPAYKDSGN
jgi:hypothetical protein